MKETAHWHAMKEIATSFRLDYEEGVPVYQKQIIKWPNTDGFYLVWRLSRESATGEPEEHRGVVRFHFFFCLWLHTYLILSR